MRRDGMSIAPKEFLTYINGALDGMVQIVEALGDEHVNLRPNNMPNTNSPFAILTHCVGLTRYFIGTALAGRQVHRDRDAEFRAQGPVAKNRPLRPWQRPPQHATGRAAGPGEGAPAPRGRGLRAARPAFGAYAFIRKMGVIRTRSINVCIRNTSNGILNAGRSRTHPRSRE